jgi:hypothetical protein
MKISLEPILPKKNPFDPARYKAEIDAATITAKNGIQADYRKTVATWDHKPTFYTTRRGYIWYIGTKDKIYSYVELGTPPHLIPKTINPNKRLAYFKTGFRPKSRVGYIASYGGAKASSNFRRPYQVHHPGTKARKFSEKIKEKWQKEFARLCKQAIRNASK